MIRLSALIFAFFFFALSAEASPRCDLALMDLKDWIDVEAQIARENVIRNTSFDGTEQGTIIASPSRNDPDYFFHWVRDGAITASSLLKLRDLTHIPSQKHVYEQHFLNWLTLSRSNQTTFTRGGLGEPKFHVNGDAYMGDWGRPQDDGPALRAVVAIQYAKKLIEEGHKSWVLENLYQPTLPAETLIKKDLEYVAHNWQNRSVDLWEEVRGHHFYTWMAQRRALLDGAELARLLDDPFAADFYEQEARKIESSLQTFFNPETGIIIPTQNASYEGCKEKKSNLDIAVILGVLHSNRNDGFMDVADERVISTFNRIEDAFHALYAINKAGDYFGLAPGIGRYPEDHFYGGNPWFLATAAAAEFNFKLRLEYMKRGSITVGKYNKHYLERVLRLSGVPILLHEGTVIDENHELFWQVLNGLGARGNAYFARIRYHAASDGSMSEQMSRENGYLTSARDLTWSYVAFLQAYWAYKVSRTHYLEYEAYQ